MSVSTPQTSRRRFLKAGVALGGAALAAPAIGTAQGRSTIWRIQTSWSGGVGLEAFNVWCNAMIEKSGGELVFEPHVAGDLVPDFEIYDALRDGQLEAVNPFTIYSNRMTPAGNFFSSYPMAMRAPHEWDVFFYGLGGIDIAREIYARNGLYFVGPVHHGPNIIHSKKPIYRFDDFNGITMRTPGGMVAEFFQSMGAKTITLPGSQIFGAFERGEIDVADFVGPSANYDYGFSKVTKFISMGPPGYMSVYQPVDLMDLTVRMDAWEALSPQMKLLVENEVHAYSDLHHAAIQSADQAAWAKFEADGTTVHRLSADDVDLMTKLAVPIWIKYAQADADSARVFKIQLDYMTSGSLGYVDPGLKSFISDQI